MRIACIANGDNIHALRWINYFAEQRHEVHLICYQAMSGYHENVHIHLLPGYSTGSWQLSGYLRFPQWIVQARKLVRELKPDILEALYITSWGFLAACTGYHPFSLCAQGSDVLVDPEKSRLKRLLVRYALKQADCVLYDSTALGQGLIGLGADTGKMHEVFNGVDTQKFRRREKNPALMERGRLSGRPVIISFREFKPVYNVEMFVKSIPSVLKQVPAAKFIIASDGKLRGQLEGLAASLGVRESVWFPGFLEHDEVPEYLALADIYVSTSLSDSTSLCLQEAMACELAPVVTDVPANREWIKNGENGFIVPMNDVDALSEKIIYLIKNDRIRGNYGKLGREIIRSRAEYRKEMGKLEDLYLKMVG